jgi:hypothetical protein
MNVCVFVCVYIYMYIYIYTHIYTHAHTHTHIKPCTTTGEGVDDGVKQRIRKMLELGLHKDTGEHEANRALQNAMRMLTKYNMDK